MSLATGSDGAAATARILDYMRANQPAIIALIRRLVEIESPSHDKAGVDRVVDAVSEEAADIAEITRFPRTVQGDHLRLECDIPTRGDGQVLGLGHLDTVWAVGTLDRMPWRVAQGRLWGPGVFDMKAGVAYLLFAARALRDLNLVSNRRYVVRLQSDEEIGSPSSMSLVKDEAGRSAAVIVAEPSAGLKGNAKTSRKGGGNFRVRVKGVPAHAGLDFEAGASAVVEAAAQIRRIASWTDLERGLTVNPGVVQGGTAPNVVAEEASVRADVRFWTSEDGREIDRRFRALRPSDPRCSIQVTGGVFSPMERTDGVARIFNLAKSISGKLGVDLGETGVGGASYGNMTAPMGIPTLDGIGAVGEGAHAMHESVLVDRIADRAALIAALVHRL